MEAADKLLQPVRRVLHRAARLSGREPQLAPTCGRETTPAQRDLEQLGDSHVATRRRRPGVTPPEPSLAPAQAPSQASAGAADLVVIGQSSPDARATRPSALATPPRS